jgi:hypothetical protein
MYFFIYIVIETKKEVTCTEAKEGYQYSNNNSPNLTKDKE